MFTPAPFIPLIARIEAAIDADPILTRRRPRRDIEILENAEFRIVRGYVEAAIRVRTSRQRSMFRISENADSAEEATEKLIAKLPVWVIALSS